MSHVSCRFSFCFLCREFFLFLFPLFFIEAREHIHHLTAAIIAAITADNVGKCLIPAMTAFHKTRGFERMMRAHAIPLPFGMPHSNYHIGKRIRKLPESQPKRKRNYRLSPVPPSCPRSRREASFSTFILATSSIPEPNSRAVWEIYQSTSPSSLKMSLRYSSSTTFPISRCIFLTLFAISPASPTSPKVG